MLRVHGSTCKYMCSRHSYMPDAHVGEVEWSRVVMWVQGRASGRLLSYNPATRKTHVVAEGIWFANGVTLSKDESFAAVVETNVQRVHRVWLSGPKVGSKSALKLRSSMSRLLCPDIVAPSIALYFLRC